MMYTEQEKKRVNRQIEYDKTHYITGDLTIYQWKENFKKDLFVEEIYWEKLIKIPNGDKIIEIWVKCEETDPSKTKNIQGRTFVNPKNYGISKAVRKQIIIYRETVREDELNLICNELIEKAITKFEVRDNYYPDNEYGKLASYIITCLDTEIQNYINIYTETFRERIDGTDRVFSPKMMMSYDVDLDENDEYNDERHIDYVLEEQNLFTIFDEYEPTDTLKIILNTLKSDLTDEQVELMEILAVTENNNKETARIIKELDIERGKELRASDDAYRVAVIREKAKIVKLVEKNLDLHKLERIGKLKLEQMEINNFLDMDIDEKQVIDYTVSNINEHYIDYIVYEKLSTKQRQHLIKNFFHNYNEDKLQDKETKEVCRYILNGLYNHIDELDEKIENLNIEKVEPLRPPTEPKKTQRVKEPITYKYYVEKDKFEQLEGYKDMEILGEKKFIVTRKNTHLLREKLLLHATSRSEFYSKFEMDCYYLGEHQDVSKDRKTEYTKIDQRGMRYRINQTTTEPEELD